MTISSKPGQVGSDEISVDESKRVCSHMNQDHAASVYAMAMDSVDVGWTITGTRMVSVSKEGCKIDAIMCSGELCKKEMIDFPFQPPLAKSSDLRKRMVAVHHDVLTPKFSWLISVPVAERGWLLSAFITALCTCLAYGVVVLGVPGMTEFIENEEARPMLNHYISKCFGSAHRFSMGILIFFWISIIVHVLEAFYAVYHSIFSFKLSWMASVLWFAFIFVEGTPIFNVMRKLRSVSMAAKTKKAS